MRVNKIDLKESYDGDLIFDDDMADTSEIVGEAGYQIIRTILATKPGENKLFPYLGFNPDTYVGKANTRKNGELFARAVHASIVESSSFLPSDIEVVAFPIGKNTIALRIKLLTIDNLEGVRIAYDTSDGSIKSMIFNDTYPDVIAPIKLPISKTINSRI